MSFLKRLFGSHKLTPPAPRLTPASHAVVSHVEIGIDAEVLPPERPEGLIPVSGTTTYHKDGIHAVAQRHGAGASGYLELAGALQLMPGGTAKQIVAVVVEDERIGYIPSYVAQGLDLRDDDREPVSVQIFTEELAGGLRAEAWAWLGPSKPRWKWSRANRPPMTPEQKRAAEHASRIELVREGLRDGRAAEFKAGMVDGVHYLETVEPIKQLKREGRLEEALELCFVAIEGAERSSKRDGLTIPPFYTEQAAIILRKLKRRDEEIAVLERYLAASPPNRQQQGKISERLQKLRQA